MAIRCPGMLPGALLSCMCLFSCNNKPTQSGNVQAYGPLHDPVFEVQFTEDANHTMHITSDGSYFYTVNGGTASIGRINRFTLDGTLDTAFSLLIDGRGLSFNQSDNCLYASIYERHIVRINMTTWQFDTVFTNIMTNIQASFALSPDGTTMYDFYNGTCNVYDFPSGTLDTTFSGMSCGTSYTTGVACIAADAEYLYTWNALLQTVYVYNAADGSYVRTMTLSNGNYGYSLSVFNGLLFAAVDANYGTGTWYGYRIRDLVDCS
jgi:hypothetical protein